MSKLSLRLSVLFSGLAAAMLCVGSAHAQDALVEGKGVKVGEGTVLRPVIGVETGYVSNLFYDNQNETQVPSLSIVGSVATGSANKDRTDTDTPEGEESQFSKGEAAALDWAAGVRLRYTEFPFASKPANLQRNLGADANLRVIVKPEGKFRFEFFDLFARDTNPTNFESNLQINRVVNSLRTGLVYQPGGRAITAGLHYKNRVDVFESGDHDFANRVQHSLILSAGWQWLPITKFTFEGSFGFFGPLGTSAWKQESNPIRGRVGVASAITEKTFGRASVGWGYAGYSFGEGYNTPIGDIEFGYRYAPTGKFSIAYSYDFQDSVNANYFRDHGVLFKLDHQIDKFVFDGILDVRLRGYRGVPPQLMGTSANREDFLIGARARLRYLYRDWLSFNATWLSNVDQTDFRYTAAPVPDDPSYIRHELRLGAMAAF